MCTSWLHHKCTYFAEDIIDKITNLFYFTRKNWMLILMYIRVLEKIILLFLSTSEVICFCLLPSSVWILTVLLPFWNLSWDKLIKWRNVVVGRHESFGKMAHAVCISFSLSNKITYILPSSRRVGLFWHLAHVSLYLIFTYTHIYVSADVWSPHSVLCSQRICPSTT